MILAEPPPSQGDLHFQIFGIPVRIHPFFWLVAVILAIRGQSTPPGEAIGWVAALLVSILIHELGHALVQRHFGGHPRITLYGMGGLASCGDCDRSTRPQPLISIAGPVAGFLFALLVLILLNVTGHPAGCTLVSVPLVDVVGIPLLGTFFYWEPLASDTTNSVISALLQINILWGAVNLLPIYPLDGGHISRELCQIWHPRQGMIVSLRISMVAAAAMALVGLSWGSFFVVLLFGYLAYSSYRALESYRASLW